MCNHERTILIFTTSFPGQNTLHCILVAISQAVLHFIGQNLILPGCYLLPGIYRLSLQKACAYSTRPVTGSQWVIGKNEFYRQDPTAVLLNAVISFPLSKAIVQISMLLNEVVDSSWMVVLEVVWEGNVILYPQYISDSLRKKAILLMI